MEIRKYFSISNHRTKQPSKQSQDATENSLIEVVRLMIQPKSVSVVEGGQLSRMQSAEKC